MLAARKMMAAAGSQPLIGRSRLAEVASSTTLTLPRPPGVRSGNTMVVVAINNGSSLWTSPAGFTERLDANGRMLSTRVAAAGEAVDYSFTTTSGALSGFILNTRLQYAVASASVSGVASGAITLSSITMPAAGWLFAFFSNPTNTVTNWTVPAGMTLLLTDTTATAGTWALFVEKVASGATGTRSSTATPDVGGRGFMFGLTP